MKKIVPEPSEIQIVRLTPPGRGAVASILVEGSNAKNLVSRLFQAKSGRQLDSFPTDRLVFGHFDLGRSRGEEVVVRCRSSAAVELHCHGGQMAIGLIERTLLEQGGHLLAWQDWVATHHVDPIRSAAHLALAEARTERTARILLDQYHGALRQAVEAVEDAVRRNEIDRAKRLLQRLLEWADLGQHLIRPWRVVFGGPSNVGKSSLINALLGYHRAIVHGESGTTRDIVTATTALDGWRVELSDTAGLRETDEPIEQAGITLARQQLESTDLVILVFDTTRPWTSSDERLITQYPSALIVWNKSDLPPDRDIFDPSGLSTSAVRGDGIEALAQAIVARLVPAPPQPGTAVPFTSAQIQALTRAAESLSTSNVEQCLKRFSHGPLASTCDVNSNGYTVNA